MGTSFSARDLALMSLLGCLSSLTTLTTNFIPAPLPGLYGVVAIPVGTILVFMARDMVGKPGAATFTQLVSGVLSTFMPGGPPLKWIIVPIWVSGGVVIDLLLHATRARLGESRWVSTTVGLIYEIPGDLILCWAFRAFLGWYLPLLFFMYGFVAIHALLGGLAGLFFPDILNRIEPVMRGAR